MPGFFIEATPYKRTISSPDGQEGEVTLRRLNAGDQAAIQDTLRMSMNDGGDTSLAVGTMRMLTVQRGLIDWSWPGPKPNAETIAQLEPEVFEQIYSHVEIGTPPTPTDGPAPTNGTAPTATEEEPKTRRRAAVGS